jgi:hypothetical protein
MSYRAAPLCLGSAVLWSGYVLRAAIWHLEKSPNLNDGRLVRATPRRVLCADRALARIAADTLRSTIDALRHDLYVARQAQQAQQAAVELRRAEADQKARGLLARLRAA